MYCCYLFYFIRFLSFTVCLLYVIVRMNMYVMFLLQQRRLNKLILIIRIYILGRICEKPIHVHTVVLPTVEQLSVAYSSHVSFVTTLEVDLHPRA